jgi:hypothetical protein
MKLIRGSLLLLGLSLASGCALFDRTEPVTLRIYEQVNESLPEPFVKRVTLPKTEKSIAVRSAPTLTEEKVANAVLTQTIGGAAILLRFDPHGIIELNELTTRCRGQFLVIFLNNRPVASWLVDRPLTRGQLLVEGDFGEEEARKAVESLNQQAKKRDRF